MKVAERSSLPHSVPTPVPGARGGRVSTQLKATGKRYSYIDPGIIWLSHRSKRTVNSLHATIWCDHIDGSFWLQDQGSRFGAAINRKAIPTGDGQRSQQVRLRDGDVIAFLGSWTQACPVSCRTERG